jgi:hypothetical protein
MAVELLNASKSGILDDVRSLIESGADIESRKKDLVSNSQRLISFVTQKWAQ